MNSHQFKQVYEWLGINLNTLGCVMLDLEPLDNMRATDAYKAALPLYFAKNKERFWIDGWVCDKVPHITLLYGLLAKAKSLELHIGAVLCDWHINEVEIEDIGFFESPYSDESYWCIVAHIKVTPELLEGHRRLEFLPHINTFDGYKPHMTIAYIQKEWGEEKRHQWIEYLKELWLGRKLKVKQTLNLGDRA